MFWGVLLFLAFAFKLWPCQYIGVRLRLYHRHDVVWVALLTEMNRRALLSATLAVVGLGLLTDPTKLSIQSGMGRNSDLYLLLVYRLAHYHPRPLGRHIIILARLDDKAASTELAILQFVVIALLSLAASLGTEPRLLPESWNAQLIFAFAITTLGATIFAFWAQTHFQRRTTAMRASLIFIMEPLFAALFAVAFYGEQLAATATVGGLLIMLAMAVSVSKKTVLRHP